MVKKRRGSQALTQEDDDLKSFLTEHEEDRLQVKKLLRTRSFGSEKSDLVQGVLKFLNEAANSLSFFEGATDLTLKTDFLKSLVRAWEVADATGTFNGNGLQAYGRIRDFSAECAEKIAGLSRGSRIPEQERVYWQEVARAGLIIVADYYRAQRLDKCRAELHRLLDFVRESLRDERMPCHGILGQIFYFSSKANRMDGRLDVSEDDLLKAASHYSERARRLSETESGIELELSHGHDERLQDALLDTRERQVEVTLRTGVIEVSRAWLYFTQCNYKGAKHSAHTALLLLSPSRDEMTQYHARLVSAAVDRVTSQFARELDETVSELTAIRDYFRTRGHSRLQARAEYELLLALILLDSTLETADHQTVKNKSPLKEAEHCFRHRSPPVVGRWESSKLTLHSRYLRHAEVKKHPSKRDFSEAIAEAERALSKAKKTNNHYCQIEAKIACGEAYFEQGVARGLSPESKKEQPAPGQRLRVPELDSLSQPDKSFAAAKQNLSEALTLCLNTNFPELTAIVRLWLARIAVRINLYDEANYHLHEFGRIRIQEHAWIQRLRAKVFSEHHRQDSLDLREEQLTKEEAFRALKRFLIDKAQQKARRDSGKVTDEIITNILGISRVTLSKWRKQLGRHRATEG